MPDILYMCIVLNVLDTYLRKSVTCDILRDASATKNWKKCAQPVNHISPGWYVTDKG